VGEKLISSAYRPTTATVPPGLTDSKAEPSALTDPELSIQTSGA
jgi:hypothetical protein